MTEVVLNEPLSQVSLLFVSSALAFLALALVLFSFQLVKLSTVRQSVRKLRPRVAGQPWSRRKSQLTK